MIISRNEYEALKARLRELEYENASLKTVNGRLRAEIARNDRDIRALTAALAGDDIDFPNSGKGGNADNTGMEDINDILDL